MRQVNNCAYQRPGAVIVLVALMIVALVGFGALAIDMNMIQSARVQLRTATDAAALSTATWIGEQPGSITREELQADAITHGQNFIASNTIQGYAIPPAGVDVVTGKAVFNQFGQYIFTPNEDGENPLYFNAVQVSATLGEGVNPGLTSILGSIMGHDSYTISSVSWASLPPRDFMLTYDKSGSMNDDTCLEHLKMMVNMRAQGYDASLNIREIWAAMGNSFPSTGAPPALQGIFNPDYSASDPGPKWGTFMNLAGIPDQGYGTSDWNMAAPSGNYVPANDPGLVYLNNSLWSYGTMVKLGVMVESPPGSGTYVSTGLLKDKDNNSLSTQNLEGLRTLTDINNDGTTESTDHNYRVGVALGVYNWTPSSSGSQIISGWGSGTNNKLSMLDSAGIRKWSEVNINNNYNSYNFKWSNYFNTIRSGNYNFDVSVNYDNFQYCFGVKTFVNYNVASREGGNPFAYATPAQPDRNVKDAIDAFFDELINVNNDDYVGANVYSTTAVHTVDLQDYNHYNVVMDKMNTFSPAGYTNTGQTLEQALDYLLESEGDIPGGQPGDGEEPRASAAKQIVLFTDGNANIKRNCSSPCSDDDYDIQLGNEYVWEEACRARQNGVVIHTFSIGINSDWETSGCPDESALPEEGECTDVAAKLADIDDCGVGQYVAHLTGGVATHIIGADMIPQIIPVLKAHAQVDGNAKLIRPSNMLH
ncbi:MAG: hypothetical protein HJJLKODD_00082 [Phycisphaerae bacterium]|nr:hypothetical protein [Phycisphaerae bacterium]